MNWINEKVNKDIIMYDLKQGLEGKFLINLISNINSHIKRETLGKLDDTIYNPEDINCRVILWHEYCVCAIFANVFK